MTPIQWNTIISNMQITSQPAGLWTQVLDFLPAGSVLRIMAWGTWSYSGQTGSCGPDGHKVSFVSPQRCLTKDAPAGALLCKVGGGTADLKGSIFPVGTASYITVPEAGGALFMTINDEMGGFDDNTGALTVTVAIRPAAVAAP